MPDLSEWDKLNALAMQHREGWRAFHEDKYAEIRYEIAPLPDGHVALRMKAAYRCGDNHGVSIPWRLYSSRNQALRAFLDQAQKQFTLPTTFTEQKEAQKRMLALLESLEPGFQEPETEAIREKQPVCTQVEKVQAKRQKPVQNELF